MPEPIIFSLEEKLAIVQALDSVILADGAVHSGEIDTLGQLMNRLDFDSNFIVQARNLSSDQSILILDKMPRCKKVFMGEILDEMALADGFMHPHEMVLIKNILKTVGITEELT